MVAYRDGWSNPQGLSGDLGDGFCGKIFGWFVGRSSKTCATILIKWFEFGISEKTSFKCLQFSSILVLSSRSMVLERFTTTPWRRQFWISTIQTTCHLSPINGFAVFQALVANIIKCWRDYLKPTVTLSSRQVTLAADDDLGRFLMRWNLPCDTICYVAHGFKNINLRILDIDILSPTDQMGFSESNLQF